MNSDFIKSPLAIFVLLPILFFGISLTASAHTPSDPNFLRPDAARPWKTLETVHFRIHHESSNRQYAQQMGAIAESVHRKLSPWLLWAPHDKTEIVILDNVDYSNGAATALPYNQFYIYMPTPTEGEIMDHNPWMEYVFTHEYVHILHLDMVSGLPEVIRGIYGRPVELLTVATFPQIFAPSWVTEGLAVFGESTNTAGYGRLNNAWYETQIQLEVQHGLHTLTEISFEGYSGSRWPYGLNYLYGAYFFKFLNERYGREVALNYIRIYSGNLIPWRMDERAQFIFGKSADELWGEFQGYLRQYASARPHPSEGEVINQPQLVYDLPYINRHLAATSEGDLYFFHDDASSHPRIHKINADGKQEVLFEAENVIGLDWHDTAGLMLNKLEVCENIKLYADLYLWKPGESSPKRLTHCGRYIRTAWHPDGQQLAAVQLHQGLSRLVRLNASGEPLETLAEMPLGDALGDLSWSADGLYLVAVVKRQSSGWGLEQFELASQTWQVLMLNGNRAVHPHYAKSGHAVYFVSDHGGSWNLRMLNLDTHEIETLSASQSGTLEAVVMPDSSYRLIEYSHHGQRVSSLKPTQNSSPRYSAISNPTPKVEAIINRNDYQEAPYDDVKDYSPLNTLKPHSWVPYLMSSADKNSYVGVSLYGADVLGFHQWTAAPNFYIDQHTLGGYAAYHFLNTLTLYADRQSFVYGLDNDPLQYRSDEVRTQALLHHSWNSTEHSIYLGGGISSEHITASLTQDSGIHATLKNTVLGLIARYNDTEFYPRSISTTDGRHIKLVTESYDILGGNIYHGNAQQFDWKEYLGFGANHVLYLRMSYAYGDDGIRPFKLGGETESLVMQDGSTDLGKRRFMLRGYPPGLASLTGTRLALLSAEWRIPLGLVYDGFFVPPIGLGRHSLSLFVDSGDAWSTGEKMQLKTGAGLAWNGEALLGYDQFHIGTTLGLARGLDQGGESRLYLLLGMPL